MGDNVNDLGRRPKFEPPESVQQTVSSLGGSAPKLWSWLRSELEGDEEYVQLDRRRYRDDSNTLSPETVRLAVRELIRAGILYPTLKQNVYWTNPYFL